jgi:hypothetical protein
VFYKLFFILFLISTIAIYVEYITDKKDIGRYVPYPGSNVTIILDTKTGAVYRPNGEGKEMKILWKPISNKIK